MRFVYHREALTEYQEAAIYYASFDPQLALRFVEAVEHAIQSIVDTPLRWLDVDDGIRRCLN